MSTREQLIDATAELLWERGYSATSPSMIQKRAGVGQGSMYHHFAGKADLAATAMRQTADRMREEVLAAAAGRRSTVETLHAYLDLERQPLLGCRLGRLAQDADVVIEGELRTVVGEFFSWLRRWAAEVLADGQRRGELRADFVPDEVAVFLVATVQGAYVLARAEQDAGMHLLAVSGIKHALQGLVANPAAAHGTAN